MSEFTVPENWGICFSGNEEAFCAALDAALVTNARQPFIYIEIGIGHGDTLRAVSQYLNESGINFELHGVDIPGFGGPARDPANYDHPSRTNISTAGATAFFEKWIEAGLHADFVFIDGCHGAPCVTDDFLHAEKLVKPGGIVAFHDTDQGCQDIHMQPHCKTGIRARAAVEKLGLLDGSRPGWKVLNETTGNKELSGHGCLFVQRI